MIHSFNYKKIEHNQYKYELLGVYSIFLDIDTDFQLIKSKYYKFDSSGMLTIKKGYRWDGASGPTIDTESTMRASCVHDVLYQMIRLRQLDRKYKAAADQILCDIMIEDGDNNSSNIFGEAWSSIRGHYFHLAVKLFGAKACEPIKTLG